jgi:hypothetical protein
MTKNQVRAVEAQCDARTARRDSARSKLSIIRRTIREQVEQ